MQPNLTSLRNQPHKGMTGLPDLRSQLFDIAAGQFGVNARLAGISQLNLDAVKVDHKVPLSCQRIVRLIYHEPVCSAIVPVGRCVSRAGPGRTNSRSASLTLPDAGRKAAALTFGQSAQLEVHFAAVGNPHSGIAAGTR
jgi:hypothetical protein